ncbi:hypothetical protein JTE90_025785 [Oedothorax gibbosus]|uniref:Uncharacterized protein n=1 Tax=Oedothorax gibbosus TaxID=931172 RepID=A0AAV6V0M4_9ARAC|nr:hypothetical protein JTE90_025785 [Oedothorax gibbosus]
MSSDNNANLDKMTDKLVSPANQAPEKKYSEIIGHCSNTETFKASNQPVSSINDVPEETYFNVKHKKEVNTESYSYEVIITEMRNDTVQNVDDSNLQKSHEELLELNRQTYEQKNKFIYHVEIIETAASKEPQDDDKGIDNKINEDILKFKRQPYKYFYENIFQNNLKPDQNSFEDKFNTNKQPFRNFFAALFGIKKQTSQNNSW